MASTALATPLESVNHNTADMEDSHDDSTAKNHDAKDDDDAATMAAREELKHTTISDKVLSISSPKPFTSSEATTEDKEMSEHEQAKVTPEPEASDTQDEIMRERITSPKKKRGRDLEDEDAREVEEADNEDTSSSPDGHTAAKRTIRSGPEKKRPRDASVDSPKTVAKIADIQVIRTSDSSDSIKPISPTSETSSKSPITSPQQVFGSGFGDKSQTSSSAFAASGFASLASSATSPFGNVGASRPSVFGSNVHSTTSGFGSFASSKSPSTTATITTTGDAAVPKPALGFGFGGASTTSGFGSLGSASVFGSALKNGFGGGSGPKLSSFAAPVKDMPATTKPTKAFGAPDSDEDEGSDDDDSEGTPDTDEEEGAKVSLDEKKKSKASKVDDGEAGETTLLQVRAKLFALETKEAGWKERGVGSLKINVPQVCASFDDAGVPIPGSFDISGLEDDDDSKGPRVPRLIMRQENTHRVILNTIIVRGMEFKDKPSQTAAQILFTAIEGEKGPKPVQILLKLSEHNARLFRSEIQSIQQEL